MIAKESGAPDSKRPLEPGTNTMRIATALAPALGAGADLPSVETVEAIIRLRSLRAAHVPGELLGDPAWDMLLELFHAELGGRPVTSSVLSKAARVSVSTGQRWIKALVSRGLCNEVNDPSDSERLFIRLSEKGSEAMHGYFADVMHSS